MLRYFNPIGAHESGQIGENPSGLPNNLMPYLLRVASGLLPVLNVWGSDYPTPDGTCIRDYIHVVDIAEAHVRALERLDRLGCLPLNIGTGCGRSVLEVINAFEKATGVKIPYVFRDRRPGDVTAAFADPSLATTTLGWLTRRSIEDMCRDAWRFQQLRLKHTIV
jgi:UDP-glucose 4-epimerase